MENNQALKGKTILLVHTGSAKKKFILQKMQKMQLRVVCLSKEKVAWAQPYVDHWIIADTNDHRECLNAIKSFNALHEKITIDGVVTFWESCTQLTSKIVDAFNLIGIPYSVARSVKNKYLFRDFCNRHDIKAPRYSLIKNIDQVAGLEKKLTYPLVIKPAYGARSAFVMRVNNRRELEESYNYIKSNIKGYDFTSEWENFDVLAEEFIDGDEVDIDLLVQNGKIKFSSVADNFNKSREMFFVDSGQAIPSALPVENQQDLVAMAEETLEKLGIQDGCIHFEAKVSNKGAFPIEVNMRMGGDYIYSYTKGTWGVDLVENSIKIALGVYIKIDKPEIPNKYIIGWDIHPDYSGILVELDVNEELKNKKYFEEIVLIKEIGDAVLMPPEGFDNSLGWVVVSGDNMLDAQDNLKEALTLINYKVVEFDKESTLGKTSRKNRLSVAVLNKELLLEAAKMQRVRSITLKDQRNLHIGIIGTISSFGQIPGRTGAYPAIMIAQALTQRGYQTTLFDCNNLPRLVNELRQSDADLIFNACDSAHSNNLLRWQITALLEALQLPYIGSSSMNLALCQDKIRMKKLLAFHNIPTRKWDYVYNLTDTISDDLKFPLIVKPADTDDSFGISNNSVVATRKQLEKQLKYIVGELGRPAIVEEYVDGYEYVVSILGDKKEDLQVLPLVRTIFKKLPRGSWPIYTQEAKMQPELIHKRVSFQSPSKKMSDKLQTLLTEIALDTYQILHCRDFGRVDIRVDTDGNPYVLELDPNPLLEANEPLCYSAELIGKNTGDLLEMIIDSAVKRYKNKHLLLF